MITKINIGIVGIGNWAMETHIPYLLERFSAEQISACDIIIEEKQLPSGMRKFAHFEDLLKHNIQALIISTPNEFHYEYALRALKKGIHVHVDKPIAEKANQIEKLISCATDMGIILSTHTQKKYINGVNVLENYIHQKLKSIYFISGLIWQKEFADYKNSWRAANITSGILMDSGFHIIDTILSILKPQYINSELTGVSALLNNANYNNDAFSSLHFKLDEVVVQVNAFRGVPSPVRKEEYQIFGENGFARLTYFHLGSEKYYEAYFVSNDGLKEEKLSDLIDSKSKLTPIQLFFDSISGDTKAAQSVLENLHCASHVIKILEQAYNPFIKKTKNNYDRSDPVLQ